MSKVRFNKRCFYTNMNKNANHRGIRFFLIVVLLSSIGVVLQNNNNKTNHMKYGNKSDSIRVLQWNKGPSLFKNKTDHLKIIIDKYKPNLISLSEANYDIAANDSNHQFLHYNVEFTDQKVGLNLSRQVVLIDKRLNYTRVENLEGKLDCTIWVKISLKGKKSLLFCRGYRQWQIVNEKDKNQFKG